MDTFWKRVRNSLTLTLLPYVGYVVIKVLHWTMRFEERGDKSFQTLYAEGKPFIGAFWHGHMLMMLTIPCRERTKVMVSRHRDGELISRIVGLFGVESFRGSTTRGSISVLKGAVKAITDGYNIVLTPDGPRGPRHRLQMGVIEIARLTGAPIIPAVFSSTKKKVFASWDRFILPYPFSKGVFFYGAPFEIPRNLGKEERESKRLELEALMRRMTCVVEQYCKTGIWNEK